MFTNRCRRLSLFAIFFIACASELPKRGCGGCHAEVVEAPKPKGISERFNTVAVGDKVYGTIPPHVKPILKPIPANPIGGKVENDFVRPLHPEVKPTVVVGHTDSSIHPIPTRVVHPTRLPHTQKPIVA
ncbi:hypothetical protein PRIPAC_75117 [Pristionchus pacificus]|uniref:Uncharacterized protein n=1 Tax=Pristionchus pacificus TaxID=54126 RepID=A0A454XRF9_PRIPA|nr:hypothetical protein PRIPAC_75117 [Pristionchus pacificus]|eukprot:PDM80931.1 hypothetical protein PRIPAC_35934 [Pristionchus pacificus]